MIRIIISILLISILFPSIDDASIEVDLGYNKANQEFEKYNDNGFTIRCTLSNNIKNSKFFRWQASFQYISFYSNTYNDSFQMSSGLDGPTIKVTNSESGYIFQGGLRFIPELGLFQDKGIFKPYTGVGIGFGHFNEITEYEDPDSDWFDDEDDYFSLDDIEHQQTNFVYSIEFGANFMFSKTKQIGLDLGIRYNMAPKIISTNVLAAEDSNSDGTIDGGISNLGTRINADYYTYYIGVSFSLNFDDDDREESKPGKRI
mgnify:CR=1 FL=1